MQCQWASNTHLAILSIWGGATRQQPIGSHGRTVAPCSNLSCSSMKKHFISSTYAYVKWDYTENAAQRDFAIGFVTIQEHLSHSIPLHLIAWTLTCNGIAPICMSLQIFSKKCHLPPCQWQKHQLRAVSANSTCRQNYN